MSSFGVHCIKLCTTSYLVSFLLDSTAGLLIIYLLLKAVAWLVSVFELTPLKSGMYGKQCLTEMMPTCDGS